MDGESADAALGPEFVGTGLPVEFLNLTTDAKGAEMLWAFRSVAIWWTEAVGCLDRYWRMISALLGAVDCFAIGDNFPVSLVNGLRSPR